MQKTKRTGLRIRTNKVDPEVALAVLRFAKWLRMYYVFPIRVPIYLYPEEKIYAKDGDLCYSIFFEPFNKNCEPYIKVATGDFLIKKKEIGRDNALAGILSSIAYQLQFYFCWCKGKKNSAAQARSKSITMINKYSLTVDHP